MANAMVAQSVNRQSVGAALQQARKECGQHLRWLNALNRAALNLEACPWQFDGDVLVIASASDGSSRYTVDVHGCGCRAAQKGNPCWHRAARRLLVKAAELAAPAPVPAPVPAPTPEPDPEPTAVDAGDVCPMCGAVLVAVEYYVGGRGYRYYEICSGDGAHYRRPA